MNDVTKPTANDMVRDLDFDSNLLIGAAEMHATLSQEARKQMPFSERALQGWPVAIRRALWAEAEVERLRTTYVRRALGAEAEVERLRAMYEAACARIADQSELLSRRAEK